MPTFDDLLDPVVKLAAEAAQAILSIYAADFTVSDKDDTSPLTEADLAAHHVLVNGLSALTPDWPILSEEGGRPDFAERSRWARATGSLTPWMAPRSSSSATANLPSTLP